MEEQQFTKTINNEEYIQTLKSVLDDIEKISKADIAAYLTKNKTFISERLSTLLRHTVDNGSPLARLIKKQILEAAYNAEKAGADSTRFFIAFVLNLIQTLLKNLENENIPNIVKKLDFDYREISNRIIEETKPATWEDIVECVTKSSDNEMLSKMVLEAVELAGLEGNIIPGGSSNGKYSVELVLGYNFPVSTYPLFTSEDGGRWGRGDVRVLVVDGIIERASELHNFFTEAYSNEKPHLIVARGYGEEVIATISANKKLDICPIRIPWEIESINFIADISIVCGSKIVSTMKGDSVATIVYDELPIVDKVICTKENLNIINNKTQQTVSSHISDLSERRENTHIEEMSELINKRIKALNSHTVHIRLGSLTEQQKMKELESIDYSLRIVKRILNKGTIYMRELGFNEKMPTTSVLSALYYGISLAKSLISIDLAIMNDD